MYASPAELHYPYHAIDLMEAKTEEMNEKMTEMMRTDPTLEPSTIIDNVLNDFTDSMAGQMKFELLTVFYPSRR